MKNLIALFAFLISMIIFTGCNKDSIDDGFEVVEGPVEFYVKGYANDATNRTKFDLPIGPDQSEDVKDRFFIGSSLSQGTNRPTLFIGIYNDNLDDSQFTIPWTESQLWQIHPPSIELQFWPDNIGADDFWSEEEVKAFFEIGNTYELGEEEGTHFGFRILLPISGQKDLVPSDAHFLANPIGTLLITEATDYEYMDIRSQIMTQKRGLRLKCTFEAEVGRYNLEADQADGDPDFFRTDEVVQITEGEAIIYVPYGQQL